MGSMFSIKSVNAASDIVNNCFCAVAQKKKENEIERLGLAVGKYTWGCK